MTQEIKCNCSTCCHNVCNEAHTESERNRRDDDAEQAEGAPARAAGAAGEGMLAVVELVGHDRPGIVRAVSAVFARHGVNVEEFSSERGGAPMGGGILFQARASIRVPAPVRLAALRADLEQIAADLMVDLSLREA